MSSLCHQRRRWGPNKNRHSIGRRVGEPKPQKNYYRKRLKKCVLEIHSLFYDAIARSLSFTHDRQERVRDEREEEGDLFVKNGSFTDAISSRCGSTLHNPSAASRELPGQVLPTAADSAALARPRLVPHSSGQVYQQGVPAGVPLCWCTCCQYPWYSTIPLYEKSS